ncbi:MAG: chemotaxis protein [Clostridia bacterium BRH_c25]|nr:MAG: chemotaxis protein [Clostridia bacterium BRH_c25]
MRWYYNMKIGVKLIIGFLIVAFIAGAIGAVGVINIRNIDALDTKLYETMTVPLGEMVIIAESYQRMRGNVKDILLSTSEAEIKDYETRIKERNEEFNNNLVSFEKTLLTEEGKKLTSDVFNYKKQYDLIVNEVIKLVRENNRDQAINLINGDAEKIRSELEKANRRMMEIKVTAAKDTADGNTRTANAATMQTIIILIIGMVVSIFFGVFISASIKKPLNKLVDASKKIADGDLDVTVDVDTKDEVGVLAQAFRRMTDNMNDAMTNINNASEQVASGSKQVSDSSIALSQGATEQASSIEELTASLEEISSQTKLNAQNANQANELAENAKSNAIQGNNQMKEMLKAMEEINESSSNISKIIKVIDEIAFQTNILALNAAVEAARAGQHGKGFAVVAEEVRNLAARSANAAKETTDMIEGSIKKVEGGTRIANETATALNKIVEGVAKAAALVSDIAVASNEQASGIAQINQGVMQVSQVVQTNSATSEESAAASEELSSQAELLKESVSKFKLKKINQTYNKFDELNPEVLKMLEGMSERKKADSEHKELARTETEASKTKIALSDKEFGKY